MAARPPGYRWRALRGVAFIGPAFVFFAAFLLLPVLAVIAVAFMTWTGFNVEDIAWRGTGNFSDLASDEVFRSALVHTVLFVGISTVLLNIVGLGLALLVHSRVRGHGFLRVAILIPLGLSPVVTAVLWRQLLGPYGFVNAVWVDWLSISDAPIEFLGDPTLAFATLTAAAVWQFCGYDMLLYYAALQSLPQERLEAAAIDGANAFNRLRFVVLPHLRPVMAVVVVLNLIGGWKVFELVLVLTNGGPNRATDVLSTYLYEQAFSFSNVGFASAIAVVIIGLATVSALMRSRIAGEATG